MADEKPARPREGPRLDAKLERGIAVDLFNYVWTLLEAPSRTRDQDDEMIHAAHASRYHWGRVGEPVNLARGEWQISRAYAVMCRAEPALWHAQRSLALCQEHGIADFDLAFAYEALARASSAAGDHAERDRWLGEARAAAVQISEQDDREFFEADLSTIR